jgi:DNA-binding PadR family transcriptional regulator
MTATLIIEQALNKDMSSTTEVADLSDYHEKSRRVIQAVGAAGGEATTSTIREYAQLSGSVLWNHAESLTVDGLLTKTHTGEPGGEPNKYALTNAGERSLAEFRDAADELSIEARIADLEAEVVALREEQRDEEKAERDELEARIERIEQRFETMQERLRSEEFVSWIRQQLSR